MDSSKYQFVSVTAPEAHTQRDYSSEELSSAVFVVKFQTKEQVALGSFYRVVFETEATDCHNAVVTFGMSNGGTSVEHLDGSIILDFPYICDIWLDVRDKFGFVGIDDNDRLKELNAYLKHNYQKAGVQL